MSTKTLCLCKPQRNSQNELFVPRKTADDFFVVLLEVSSRELMSLTQVRSVDRQQTTLYVLVSLIKNQEIKISANLCFGWLI